MRYIQVILAACLLSLAAAAQDVQPVELDSVQQSVSDRLSQFADSYSELLDEGNSQLRFVKGMPITKNSLSIMNGRLTLVENALKAIDFRWNTFHQAMQMEIADNDELMSQMTEVQTQRQEVVDTLAAKRHTYQALLDFITAETLIFSQDSTYKNYYKKAVKLSMTAKLAPRLEKLKTQEQALAASLQEAYTKAKAATAVVPTLSERMAQMDEEYSNLQVVSKQIQATEYKPFFQRIKDYLLGLGCVSLFLMFLNLIWTKIQFARKQRQAMKQYQDMMRQSGNNQDYPTI